MNNLPPGSDSILLGIGAGITTAALSGIGITLGVTALISITSVVSKEVGLFIVKQYRNYKRKKAAK